MSDIVWEDPGPPGSQGGTRRGRWMRLAEQLRAHPGKWAVAADTANGETTSRRQPDGTSRLYARWVEDVT